MESWEDISRGRALLSSPLLLRCWSWRPEAAASCACVAPGDSPLPLGQRTPEEGVGRPVVLAGVAQQASAGGGQADGVDKVFQDAVLHVGEGAVEQRLLQEQTHQRGLEALVSQLPQGLQDTGDPQVVVLGPKNSEERSEASGKSWNVCVCGTCVWKWNYSLRCRKRSCQFGARATFPLLSSSLMP